MSPNVNDLKQSNFLTQNDVDPPVLVTIQSCKQVNVAREGAEPEYRWCLTFHELEKPMTLNVTNGLIIAAMIGSDEINDSIGHKIVLYREPNIMFGNKLVGGIRCREPRKQTEPDAPKPSTVEERKQTFNETAKESDKLADEIAQKARDDAAAKEHDDDIPF